MNRKALLTGALLAGTFILGGCASTTDLANLRTQVEQAQATADSASRDAAAAKALAEQAKADAAGSGPRATFPPTGSEELRTPASLRPGQGVVVVSVAQKPNVTQALEFRKILLEALRQSPHVRLDMEQTREVDASFVQLVAATYQSCIGKNGSFGFLAPPRDPVAETLRDLGLAWLLRNAA